jgi:hypothetical protein
MSEVSGITPDLDHVVVFTDVPRCDQALWRRPSL